MIISRLKYLFFFLLILILFNSCERDCDCNPIILGCTDSTAVNFDPTATHNNGSCEYPVMLSGIWVVNENLSDCPADLVNNQLQVIEGSSDNEIIFQDFWVSNSLLPIEGDLVGIVDGNTINFQDISVDITLITVTISVTGTINNDGNQITLFVDANDLPIPIPGLGLPCSYVYDKIIIVTN